MTLTKERMVFVASQVKAWRRARLACDANVGTYACAPCLAAERPAHAPCNMKSGRVVDVHVYLAHV